MCIALLRASGNPTVTHTVVIADNPMHRPSVDFEEPHSIMYNIHDYRTNMTNAFVTAVHCLCYPSLAVGPSAAVTRGLSGALEPCNSGAPLGAPLLQTVVLLVCARGATPRHGSAPSGAPAVLLLCACANSTAFSCAQRKRTVCSSALCLLHLAPWAYRRLGCWRRLMPWGGPPPQLFPWWVLVATSLTYVRLLTFESFSVFWIRGLC